MKILGLIFESTVKMMVVNVFLHPIPKSKVTSYFRRKLYSKLILLKHLLFKERGKVLVISNFFLNRNALGATAVLFLTCKW